MEGWEVGELVGGDSRLTKRSQTNPRRTFLFLVARQCFSLIVSFLYTILRQVESLLYTYSPISSLALSCAWPASASTPILIDLACPPSSFCSSSSSHPSTPTASTPPPQHNKHACHYCLPSVPGRGLQRLPNSQCPSR